MAGPGLSGLLALLLAVPSPRLDHRGSGTSFFLSAFSQVSGSNFFPSAFVARFLRLLTLLCPESP